MSTQTATKPRSITDGERVGHYMYSHGFTRAFHGSTQIGSWAPEAENTPPAEAEQRRSEQLTRACDDIAARLNDGRTVTAFFGGFYAA